jgi:hypothetical protein
MGADEIVRLYEIDSRLFVSIYRELQHGRRENVRTNPERPAKDAKNTLQTTADALANVSSIIRKTSAGR